MTLLPEPLYQLLWLPPVAPGMRVLCPIDFGYLRVCCCHRVRTKLGFLIWDEMWVFLPVGVVMAIALVGAVYWFSRRRLTPQAELELAVRNREFIVNHQPIIELSTGICVGAEALVRWKMPDGTFVRPDLFIPVAEETGLIAPTTDQVIDTVIREPESDIDS